MKNKLKSLTVVAGAFLALVIVFTQLFHFQVSQPAAGKTKTEQHKKDQKSGHESQVSALSSFSLPSSATITMDVESICLFDISVEKEGVVKYPLELPRYTSKFLQTLFRFIISPNAP